MTPSTFYKITATPQELHFDSKMLLACAVLDPLATASSALMIKSTAPSILCTLQKGTLENTKLSFLLEENVKYSVWSTNGPIHIYINDVLDLQTQFAVKVTENVFVPTFDMFLSRIKTEKTTGVLSLRCDEEVAVLGHFKNCDTLKIEMVLYKGRSYEFVMDGFRAITLMGYSKRCEIDENAIILSDVEKMFELEDKRVVQKVPHLLHKKMKPESGKKIPKKAIVRDHVEIKRKKKVTFAEDTLNQKNVVKTEIKQKGTGKVIKKGDTVRIRYKGCLENGQIFDSTKKKPFSFVFGKGEVIKGLELGMEKMCVGEKREIVVPAKLGYGKKGSGVIPPNSKLIFSVELIG